MPKVIRFAGLLLAAGMTCGAAAAGEKKPNSLTPKEIADGWLMLFDGETTFGWKAEGLVAVKDGVLIVGGEKGGKLSSTSEFGRMEYSLEIATKGTGCKWSLGGNPGKLDMESIGVGMDATGFISGGERRSPVRFEVPPGGIVEIRRLWVRPVETKYVFNGKELPGRFLPLFNGKDLSGWKVFQDPKRSKSKFEVTPAGELHITNGPGDLQTERKYADFVLQLECKTNGQHLNSGVFFRCVPDQYQNGYEAQIHNGFKDNDRTKPTDFGTGAIYRRVPARKVVANDNEWFTLTVVANGPHIATWVNGYQTVDWTDDRKPADNPRQGLRTAAGHISIQGHDPTTDILFRDIRIAELK
jgi:hypothetical protein